MPEIASPNSNTTRDGTSNNFLWLSFLSPILKITDFLNFFSVFFPMTDERFDTNII
jgi:hypothetical protein